MNLLENRPYLYKKKEVTTSVLYGEKIAVKKENKLSINSHRARLLNTNLGLNQLKCEGIWKQAIKVKSE